MSEHFHGYPTDKIEYLSPDNMPRFYQKSDILPTILSLFAHEK